MFPDGLRGAWDEDRHAPLEQLLLQTAYSGGQRAVLQALGAPPLYLAESNKGIIQINEPYQRFKASMKVLYFSILQHYHLRYILSKKGLLPYKLVDFLNDMTQRQFLESDGATWRFRHRLLQDYFAAKTF